MSEKEIRRVVSGFRRGVLGRSKSAFMCRVVCLPLQGFLSALGLNTELVTGEVDCGGYEMAHTWLRLQDGRIIDPTADQFPLGLPKVYIGKLPAQYETGP